MPLISNKRDFLARRACGLGLVGLVERLARRPGLLVLTYHRVGDPSASPYYAPVFSATAETLAEHLRALCRTHRVVTAAEAAARIADGLPVREPTALVTFDDGYRDNVDAALPVLKAAGVPATFFLAADFLESPRLPWWDHIAYVVHKAEVPALTLDWPEPLAFDLTTAPRAGVIARIVQSYLDHHVDDDRRFRAELEDRAGVHVDDPALGRALFLTRDQARTLADAGVSVGSHSRTHRNLARLSEADQRDELFESRRILEAALGRAVTTLAYPYGWAGTYDTRTARLAREAGYRAAFSSAEGVNRPGATDPYAVRRLGVGFAGSPSLHRARWALFQAFGGSFL